MNRRFLVEFTIAIFLLLSACFNGEDEKLQKVQDRESEVLHEATPDEPNPALLVPELAHEQAPDSFKVKFQTTQGSFVVQVERRWAPNGSDRFFNLTKIGYFEEVAFYRAIEGFIVQFGIHGNPQINREWANARIRDDPVKSSNKRGSLTFAMSGPNSRTTQLFINLKDNPDLDAQGFAPIGYVVEGLPVVDSLYTGYGEPAPKGKGPRLRVLNSQGNDYLRGQFPKLDYILGASIVG